MKRRTVLDQNSIDTFKSFSFFVHFVFLLRDSIERFRGSSFCEYANTWCTRAAYALQFVFLNFSKKSRHSIDKLAGKKHLQMMSIFFNWKFFPVFSIYIFIFSFSFGEWIVFGWQTWHFSTHNISPFFSKLSVCAISPASLGVAPVPNRTWFRSSSYSRSLSAPREKAATQSARGWLTVQTFFSSHWTRKELTARFEFCCSSPNFIGSSCTGRFFGVPGPLYLVFKSVTVAVSNVNRPNFKSKTNINSSCSSSASCHGCCQKSWSQQVGSNWRTSLDCSHSDSEIFWNSWRSHFPNCSPPYFFGGSIRIFCVCSFLCVVVVVVGFFLLLLFLCLRV